MHPWSDFPQRLIADFPRWKKWYLVAFVCVQFIAIVVMLSPALQTSSGKALVYGYFIFALGSFLVLLREIGRRTRSGMNQLGQAAKPLRIVYWLMLYIGLPTVAVFVMILLNDVFFSVFTGFGETVRVQQPSIPLWWSVVLALFASSEEIWRISFLVLSLLIARSLNGRMWQRSTRYRWYSLLASLIISSVVFGVGHVPNISGYMIPNLCLSSLTGLFLGAVTIFTRRIYAAMVAHSLYDFLAMSGTESLFAVIVYGLSIISIIVGLVLCKSMTRYITTKKDDTINH